MLFFFCGHIFSQQSSCSGVLINGVCWAKSNVDKPGTFASTPEAWGMSYQWNRKKGWDINGGHIGEEIDITGERWEAVNDPCPTGWRVPAIEEMETLLDEEKVTYVFERDKGYRFVDKHTGNSIFLPFAESFNTGSAAKVYWSNTGKDDLAWALYIFQTNPHIVTMELPSRAGWSVRCVADWNVSECKEIKRDTSVTICAKDLPYDFCDTTFEEGTMSGTYMFQRIQALTGCDSIVTLKLTVKPECGKPCPGVLINGVCWAKFNVDEPGTFANPQKPHGMLYQWNRLKGWPIKGSVTGWDNSVDPAENWEPDNDPCPAGWRMPTLEEMNALVDEAKVTYTETTQDGVWGARFKDNLTGTAIFFPAVGFRYGAETTSDDRVYYWTGTSNQLMERGFIRSSREDAIGYSVRCVADDKDCDIVLAFSETICVEQLPYPWHDTLFDIGTKTGEYCFRHTRQGTTCDSIVYLYLNIDSTCNKPCKEGGVLINGLCWAEFNVDEPGKFANAEKPHGMLYQWNRKKGWPYAGDVTGWDGSEAEGDSWEAINDPCPKGWRVPTMEEMHALADDSKVTHEYTHLNGIYGSKFTDHATGNTIFLPTTGLRDSEMAPENENKLCYYWSSSPYKHEGSAKCLLTGTIVRSMWISRHYGSPVRCITGHGALECEDIKRDTSVTICAKDLPYDFCDTTFEKGTVSGTYIFRHPQAHTSCDSIVYLNLTIQDIPPLEFFGEICQGGNYTENDFKLQAVMRDTVVCDTLKTRWGCDSVRTLYLTVHPAYKTIVHDTICQGDPYHGYGFTLTSAETSTEGTLTRDSIYESIHRCDSLVILNLFVSKSYLFETKREICQGDTVMWRGKQYDTQGTYEEPFTTVHGGCDSVYRLRLTVHPVYDMAFFGEVCHGEGHNEYGFFVASATKDTVVHQELKTWRNCDSVRTLYLTVHPVYDTVVYDIVCQGDPYHSHGFTLTGAETSQEGMLMRDRTAQSIHGCDSVIHLYLFVGETYLFETEREICQGDTVMWRGESYDKEGTYEEPFTTVHGCDSVYRLQLTVHLVYDMAFFGEVCHEEDYNEDGFFIASASKDTIVRQELKTHHQCDSIRTLYLTVHPVYDTIVRDTVCEGDPYYRHGVSISHAQPSGDGKPAMYRNTYPSIHGCDSTVTLFLTVHPISDTTLYDAICRGDGYRKHGFSLDASQFPKEGTYSFNRKERNMHGCDSTIHLSLTVHPDYLFPRTEHICQGETFEFRDKPYTASGFYADTLATIHGCDSVYTLSLTVDSVYDVRLEGVLCEGEEYVRDGFRVKEPGTHVLYLRSVHGCDSTVTLTLTEEKKVEGSIGFLLEDCTRHGYGFEFSPSLPVREWVWDMGDGTAYRTEEGYHRYADSGTYRVLLRTLTDNGCGNEFLHVQRVPPYLDRVTVRADRQVVDEEYPTVRFRAEVLPGMECEWDFGDGTTGRGCETDHTYATAEARTYAVTLRVTNGDGCITEEEVTVEAVVFPKAVNTFSPNGDGINDVFMAGFRIEVMNRNGLKIYSGGNGWDGTYKGGEAKEDTYFYRVTFRTATGERTKTGYVNLIR